MKIHCFYNDLLLSLQHFFDRIIFYEGYIKTYQLNIGNPSIQLSYSGNFELPSMLINYTDSKAMFYHPYTFQKTPLGRNNNTYPVLYDKNKRLSLILHEELFEFDMDVVINCETQLSAIEIKHILSTKMVIGKYFHQYKFYSFLKVDEQFLNENMFDTNNDEIVNLFLKYNPIDDTTDHYFSIQYEPLIKLNDVSLQIGSAEQRSFQLVLPLTLINPIPIYVEIPYEERPKHSIKINKPIKDIIISTGTKPILQISIKETEFSNYIIGMDTLNGIDVTQLSDNIQTRLFHSQFHITKSKDDIEYNGIVNGKIIGIYRSGIAYVKISDMTVECFVKIHTMFESDVVSVEFFSPMIGQIYNATLVYKYTDDETSIPTYESNHNIETITVSGLFNGTFNNKSVRTPLSFEFKCESSYYDLKIFNIDINQTVHNVYVRSVPVQNVKESIVGFNSYIMKVIPEKIKIKKLLLSCPINNTTIEKYPVNDCFCDIRGNFIFPIPIIDTSTGDIIDANVIGHIDPSSLRFFSTLNGKGILNYCGVDEEVELLGCIIDFEFDSVPGFGARFIDSISINVLDTDQSISTSSINIKRTVYNISISKKILKTYIIDKSIVNNSFIKYNNGYKFRLTFDINFNYDELLSKSIPIGWCFNVELVGNRTQNIVFENGNSDILLLDRDGILPSHILEFFCTNNIYSTIFGMMRFDNPVYFQMYEIKS